MTKQITAAERTIAFSQGSRPVPPPSTTSPALQLVPSTAPSIPTPAEKSLPSKTQPWDREQLRCQWELFSNISREVLPLIKRHYEEVGLNGHEFDPDWDAVYRLERAGAHMLWTARTKAGTLAAYAQCAFTRGFHSHSVQMCCVEAIWMAPEWREGLRGMRFAKSVVEAIRDLNKINTVRIFTNDDFDKGKDGRSRLAMLLERIGLRQVGTIMELDF